MQAFLQMPMYASDMAKAASRLRELRERAGLSLRELARQIGEDHSNVGFWERSGKIPRSDVLLPIAKALGTTVEDLLGQTPKRRAPAAGGRLGRILDAVSSLPRRQQEKVIDMFETMLAGQQSKATAAAKPTTAK